MNTTTDNCIDPDSQTIEAIKTIVNDCIKEHVKILLINHHPELASILVNMLVNIGIELEKDEIDESLPENHLSVGMDNVASLYFGQISPETITDQEVENIHTEMETLMQHIGERLQAAEQD